MRCECVRHCYCYRRPGIGRLIFDLFLVMITGGLWLLWLFIRFLRSNSR